jgi:hypothetical protein
MSNDRAAVTVDQPVAYHVLEFNEWSERNLRAKKEGKGVFIRGP